ncbi:MAG TPA: lipoyl(octanoyl) transferase LipB [Anaerolineales bacterium]|nr:lipoyl(octanoyl) transferase LipB [Anaerolineales bacterium]HMV97307.1 lipoyl(octanoyl) transferase LipB [Anaerolineales bacterium]HMX19839.1 lipoyl(octanoyl) transferase LipB [Anaerolineales bacterium]HMX73708.1 lipoyl(octanoyl) transferase LipB [Anaerolineales bacterium]HMZ42097.1 lipoyl(octanoyl) transferase LipB [Anaerolineales bacterium]
MFPFTIEDLGLIEYEKAWKLQDDYAAEIAEGKRPPTLLLLEHPHVYTFGRKGHAENLLWNEEQLKQKGIATHWVDRGGDVTYHGPGQLVGYPLLSLGKLNNENKLPEADYVGYVRKLEETLITALMHFGIVSGQRSGLTGVWIQSDVHSRCPRCSPEDRKKPAKIAAIGVKVDARGITRHGFALNVEPDMEYWNGIIACGLNEPVVSLADLLDPAPSMQQVKAEVTRAFREVFAL